MESTTTKKISFWEQYSYSIAFILCLVLLVCSAFVPALGVLAMLIFMASACYFDANKTLGLLFLFLFTEIVLRSYLFTSFAFAFAFGAIFVKAYIAKKIKWNNKLIIPLSLIGVVFIMCLFVHNVTQNFSIAPFRYPIILLAILCVHLLKNEFDVKEIFRYFYCALFATCLFGLIFLFPNPSGVHSYMMDEFDYIRYQGLTGHPNTLYAYPLLIIGVGMFLYFKDKIKLWEFLPVALLSVAIGYVTWSKAFLILIVICFLLFFCCSFKKGINYVFVEIFIILIATALGYIILKDQIIKFVDRFFLYFTDGNLINMLTTGRYDIWVHYCDMWKQSTSSIIFGIGGNFVDFADFDNPLNYVHCAYLDILVKFGIVGTIVICAFFAYLIYDLPKKGLRFINFIPLIIIMLNMADEEFISSKIIVLLIAIMCLFNNEQKQAVEQAPNQTQTNENEVLTQPIETQAETGVGDKTKQNVNKPKKANKPKKQTKPSTKQPAKNGKNAKNV